MPLHDVVWTARRSRFKWLVVGSSLTVAVAHVPVIAPHLEEARYMGVLFVALTASCLAIAAVLAVRDSALAYGLAAFSCGPAIAGYIATRLVAFPQLADDVGNWLDPFGVVSVLSEVVVVAAVIVALRTPTLPLETASA